MDMRMQLNQSRLKMVWVTYLEYPVTLGAIRLSILHEIRVLQVQCIILKAGGLLQIA